MSKLLIFASYYFFLWAGENQNERRHIHIYRKNSKNQIGAKFWLDTLEVFEKGDFNQREINQIRKDIVKYMDLINKQIDLLFAGKKVKAINIHAKKKR